MSDPAPAIPAASDPKALLARTRAGAEAAEAFQARAREVLAARLVDGGRVSGAAMDEAQHAAHAFAWIATYAQSLRQLHLWAERLEAHGALGETERLILSIGFGEYLAQLSGGIPMSQGEMARPQDIGIEAGLGEDAGWLALHGNSVGARARLATLMAEQEGAASFGATGLDDEFEMIRAQFRRFADERVVPHAHGWHLRDELIPMEVIEEMAGLGVFGLTIPEAHGGLGLGKTAMCVVSEELSRG